MLEQCRWARRSAIVALAGSAAALALLVGAPAAAAASTLYVNAATGADSVTCGASTAPCQTIQQAVTNASAGDTIDVAAGAYTDVTFRQCTAPDNSGWPCSASVVIDKSLTLNGAQAGHAGSAARAAAAPATESVVSGGPFEIQAPGVTVDGFAFTNPGTQLCIGCDPGPFGVASDVTVRNSVFSGYEASSYGIYQVDAAIGVNDAVNTHITGNYFNSPAANMSAVVQWFAGGCSGADVSDNRFDAADQSASADIYFWCDNFSLPGQTTGTITVSGNRDTNMGSSDFAFFTNIDAGTAGQIDVTGNTAALPPSSGASAIYFTNARGLVRLNVSGNAVHGATFRAVKLNTSAGIPGPVTITGNDFSHNGVGVYVGSGALATGATVTLGGNDLSAETGDSADPPVGLDDLSGGSSVHATDNWWGCNGGPGAAGCSGIAGGATIDPWLVLTVSASPSSLSTGHTSAVTADLTHDSAGNDASSIGTILDGTSIAFATDLGSLSASSAGSSAGKAAVALTSSSPGTATVSATLGSQTVSTAVTFNPGDTTPPVLTLPASPVTVDAASAAGATVSFTATATDNVDPHPALSCSPASGSRFPIGDTTVHCIATDAAGNSSNGMFTVHVEGAGEQLADLLQWVVQQKLGPGFSLPAQLRAAISQLKKTPTTCVLLRVLQLDVQLQSGRQIPRQDATTIVADLTRIRNVLGC